MTPLTIQSPTSVSVTFDLGEVHNVSVGLLTTLEANSIQVGIAAAALGLSMGRLIAPTRMEEAEEVTYLEALFDWVGAYFVEGGTN